METNHCPDLSVKVVDDATKPKHATKNAGRVVGKLAIPTFKLTPGDNGLGTYAY